MPETQIEPTFPAWLGEGVGTCFLELMGYTIPVTPTMARQLLTAYAAGIPEFAIEATGYDARWQDDEELTRMQYGWGLGFSSPRDQGWQIHGGFVGFPRPLPPGLVTIDELPWSPNMGYQGYWFMRPVALEYFSTRTMRLQYDRQGLVGFGEHTWGRRHAYQILRSLEHGCFTRPRTPGGEPVVTYQQVDRDDPDYDEDDETDADDE